MDTQPQRGNNALPAEITPTVVIDHHPDWGRNGDVTYVDVRESHGATSTIVTEYLPFLRNIIGNAALVLRNHAP